MASCCDITASDLRHKLTIQTESEVSDGQGGTTKSWTDGATLSAKIEPSKGWERFQAQQVATPVTHKITTRYRADLTTKNRLKLGTRIFRIKELLNVEERNQWLQIRAIEQQ